MLLVQVGERDRLDFDGDRARLDLGQVQDVVDQVQQVGARGVDVPRELDLLRQQVARRVFGQLLAQDQDGVQRRAQLMRHVREELGLVLRRERQLLGLLLERVTGLLDFGVLALHFGVLLGQQPRLGAQLFVGLLQFALPALQFDRELLRLLSRPSVRIVASIVLNTAPMLCVSRSRKASEPALKSCSAASSITALVWPSNSTGRTMMLTCAPSRGWTRC